MTRRTTIFIAGNQPYKDPREFTLTFRAGEGVTEEVVRVVVHPDLAAEALQTRCDELFTRFQCNIQSPARDYQHRELQTLLLPRAVHLNAISCERYWIDNIGGLTFSGFSSLNDLLYILPRPLYDLFTNSDVPRADMSAWALLGLKEGESSRAAIRRAYHQRSLEWHPDKWHALAAALPSTWQQELAGVYALITQAYDQLTHTAAR
ncbi:PXMP4, PMP24 [Phytophthora cinnamomi]|uniref:PXMP4, PMP24 n=1 Tax=Phytophthora cinnamomi TaxID=4785 RepID=UPI00355A6A3E|nr:PXMP4, PMP24 [Phytophthora cinnamomi]